MLNVTRTQVELSWKFSSDDVKSRISVDPRDILTATFNTDESYTTLSNLLPGTQYSIAIFPVKETGFDHFETLGDPLIVSETTNLDQPVVEILNIGDTSCHGSVSLIGRFEWIQVVILNQLLYHYDAVAIRYGDSLRWHFHGLSPGTPYTISTKV